MKRTWLGWKYALLVIGLIVLTLLVMDFNNRMAELRRLSDKREDVAVEATNLIQTQVQLETQIVYATSEGAVEEWAYEEGHMVREGENLVIPLEYPGFTPKVNILPTATPVPKTNWQIWVSLFLESR
jgi:multidrug efflux pump subunit AcrA (membrane-fusion protein)